MKKLNVKTFTNETREEILSWSKNIEFIKGEGELLVDNGYVKIGQKVVLTSAGNVYKIEEDLLEDIKEVIENC